MNAEPGTGREGASPPHWRPMRPDDLPTVTAIACLVHPHHPEDAAVFAERLRLCPAGCFVLHGSEGLLGYAIGHPWRAGDVPGLNTLLQRVPDRATILHIHDVAILPGARGQGAGSAIVASMTACADALALPGMSLVAVGGSEPFWRRHGFERAADASKGPGLSSYGEGAISMHRPVGAHSPGPP